jgi:protein-S-isoprenylcysteine O-methyltransferase Ste14
MRGRPLALLTDAFFVVLAFYFVYVYSRSLFVYRQPVTLFFLIYQLVALTLLLIRRNATAFSSNALDYIYALVGLGAPLFFRPVEGYTGSVLAVLLELAGAFFVVGAFLSLNRSFGIAPENRGIKTMGFYHVVRHPMYLGYILAETGFVMGNLSQYNLFVLLIAIVFLILRVRAEERLLREDPEYQEYTKRTPWKLIPLVF